MPSSLNWIDREIIALKEADLWRTLAVRASAQSPIINLNGNPLINFGSNDYLNLADDSRLKEAVRRSIDNEGCGSGASPLVNGRGQAHAHLEQQLAEFENCEAALLYPSGYAANTGAISALVGKEDAVFSDALNHASIIDGCRLSRAEIFVYRHGDVNHLVELLSRADGFRRKLVVTDSLFSMEGDFAPLVEIVNAAKEYECMVMVDEAHATGVWGKRGRGLCEQFNVESEADIRVGTLSKALGSAGGFVAGSRRLIDWLANRSRSYVFSTAQPAAVAAAAEAALWILKEEPYRREELRKRAQYLREKLGNHGWDIGQSRSQIIPVVVGDPKRALSLSAHLRKRGFFVPAIRPPSIPPGRSLLRISLSYGHTMNMVERLAVAFTEP